MGKKGNHRPFFALEVFEGVTKLDCFLAFADFLAESEGKNLDEVTPVSLKREIKRRSTLLRHAGWAPCATGQRLSGPVGDGPKQDACNCAGDDAAGDPHAPDCPVWKT